jgi:CubicO group peptidase (beta-lactamase class C family)
MSIVNRLITKLFIPVALALFTFTSCNQPKKEETHQSDKADKINQLVSDYTDYGKFNGSVLVAHEGKVIFKKGYGFANMEWDIPNEPNTKFRLASLTKQFTAMLIVQLIAENKLKLHEPISTYLPNYPKKNADSITVHHLLTHTSGTRELDDFITYRDIERDRLKPDDLMNIFKNGDLEFTPGSKYKYSNPGYVILGVIIEKVTGRAYKDVLQDKIFSPLQMNNTGYDQNYTVLKNRASGYSRIYLRGQYVNSNYVDMSIPYAAGSIYSTVEDLHLWDQALYTEKLLPSKYIDLLFDTYIPTRNRHYGYGWFINDIQMGNSKEQITTMNHGGGINGFNTRIVRIPSTRSLIVLLNNTDRAPLNELTIAINGIIHDKSYNPNKSVAYSMANFLAKTDNTDAQIFFNQIINSDDYYLDETEMNIAGYELLQAEKLQECKVIFGLNVSSFPESGNVYDSYGEVLLLLGDSAGAITNYKKSVELNPRNQNGIQVLKALGIE